MLEVEWVSANLVVSAEGHSESIHQKISVFFVTLDRPTSIVHKQLFRLLHDSVVLKIPRSCVYWISAMIHRCKGS